VDRRKFIKNSLLAGAIVATSAIMGNSVFSDNKNTGSKSMKILVITGSPRKNGNSNFLVDNFIKGAQEKGHKIFRFDSAFKKVHPCIACNKCGMNGDCVSTMILIMSGKTLLMPIWWYLQHLCIISEYPHK